MTAMARTRWRVSAPGWLLLALALGFVVGIAIGRPTGAVVDLARLAGGLWLDALRATIIPLVFALVATGVASLGGTMAGGEAAHIARRLPVTIVAFLIVGAIVPAIVVPPLLAAMPIGADAIAGLRAAFPPVVPPAQPGMIDAIRALVPVNIVASAAGGAVVPLVIFALVLGMALGRMEPRRSAALLDALRGLGEAMTLIVGWILRAAPVGIFALALLIGATIGLRVVGTLGQYLATSAFVSILLIASGHLAAHRFGGAGLARFARAIAPAQAVAASTQSSIATLPAMLAAADRLGVRQKDAAITLPLAVAVFKITAPSNAIVVGLSLAWMAGLPVSAGQIVLAIPIALLSTLAVLGLPGPVSFFAATVPTAAALGAPIELTAILLAVDTIPDIFRTVANATTDVATAVIVSRPDVP